MNGHHHAAYEQHPAPRRGKWRIAAEEEDDPDNDSLASSSELPDSLPKGSHAHRHEESNPSDLAFDDSDELSYIPDEPIVHIPFWVAKRHLTCGNPTPPPAWMPQMGPWRSPPGKLKTANAALVLCMNIETDPPDVVRPTQHATLECWLDPSALPSNKALEAIGSNLQHQFESMSLKIPYKPILDPTMEDFRKYCVNLRKQAKDDTALLYYNGHGVPRPTPNGEMWCFNRNYTQYIPVAIADVQLWVGSPAVHIWDCSAAGYLMQAFLKAAALKDDDAVQRLRAERMGAEHTEPPQPYLSSLCFAACASNEELPTAPDLPADVFTACLTSPIDMALRYFALRTPLPDGTRAADVMQIPGDLKDRRTPLGELNWIFTAITDTIAWTTFPHDVFTRLYRSDLLIASLFRNFLLAERIMKDYDCHPHTHPALPATNTHPLWASWDSAVDECLRQLPAMREGGEPADFAIIPSAQRARRPTGGAPPPPPKYPYIPSRFFPDQLCAFEVWLSRGGSALTKRGPRSLPGALTPPAPKKGTPVNVNAQSEDHLVPRKPPEQLPIVLQVLLSQPHRLRALILLSQFVDLGPWAVHLALQIGIFPYISKLLQAAGQELRPVLIFIWARILAVDPTCQGDLLGNMGYKYFANVLASPEIPLLSASATMNGGGAGNAVVPNHAEHKAMCAFVLASIARGHRRGQSAVVGERVFHTCVVLLDDEDFLVRQWAALAIGQIWAGNDEVKVEGVENGVQDRLIGMLSDESAEVRAAVVWALSTFLGASATVGLDDKEKEKEKKGEKGSAKEILAAGSGGGTGSMTQLDERTHFRMEVAVVTGAALTVCLDGSPMVRKELLVLVSCLTKEWRGYFVICAWIYWEEARRKEAGLTPGHHEDVVTQAIDNWLEGYEDDEPAREENRVVLTSFYTIYTTLLELTEDTYPEVALAAQTVVDYATALLIESPFTRLEGSNIRNARQNLGMDAPLKQEGSRMRTISTGSDNPPPSPSLLRPSLSRADTAQSSMSSTLSSAASSTIRRTSSFANALKSLAGGIAFPSTTTLVDDTRSGASSPTATSRLSKHHTPANDGPQCPPPNLCVTTYNSPYPRPSSSRSSGGKKGRAGVLERDPIADEPPVDFSPSDVMEALMEEDMERLRARRRLGAAAAARGHHGHHGGVGYLPSPSESIFSADVNVNMGLGTGTGIKDALPLQSRYYEWCVEYFKEPQMRQSEQDDAGSVAYNHQVWRVDRNEKIVQQVGSQALKAAHRQWTKPVKSIQTSGCPLYMAMHAYDPHLVTANESDVISVYDWSTRRLLNQFPNGSTPGYGVTSLHLINQWHGGMILTGSADGVAKLFRNYDPSAGQGPTQLVSSFRVLSETIALKRGAGMVLDWHQQSGTLLASGDSRVVRPWDANMEMSTGDIETHAEAPCTALALEGVQGQTFLAGFADGSVKVMDRRMEEEDAVVREYRVHTAWVQGIKWNPMAPTQFYTASLDGEVKLFDLRSHDGALNEWDQRAHGIAAMDVHPRAGVFATASTVDSLHWKRQYVKVMTQSEEDDVLADLVLPSGLVTPPARPRPSRWAARCSSLVFHPMEMLYAIGQPSGAVRIYGCDLALSEADLEAEMSPRQPRGAHE